MKIFQYKKISLTAYLLMARDEGIEPPTVPQDCGKDRHVHVYFVQATELDFFSNTKK